MNSIDQYNQMIDSLTERGYYKRKNFAIGGGQFKGTDLGTREGFSKLYGPNIRKLTQSDSLEVQVVRGGKGGGKGGQKFYKTFNFSDYGSEANALKAAEEYRDSIPKIKKDTGKQSKGLPIGFKKQTGGQAEIRKALNDIVEVGGKSFSNEDIRQLIDTDLFPNDDQFRKAVDVVKKEPEFKNLTFEKKPRPRLKNDPVSVLQAATAKRRSKKLDLLGSKDYEKELYKFKKEVQEGLGLEPVKTTGAISGKPREFLPIDMGHQSSIDQLKLLKQQLRPEDLNPQFYKANREGIRKFEGGVRTLEASLKKDFYPEQKKLYNQAKKFIDAGESVPTDLQNKIVTSNEKIQKFINNTVEKYPLLKDRVNAITIDANDLTVKRGGNVLKELGIGLVDQDLGNIKLNSVDDLTIKANLAQQTLQEAVDAGLINKNTGQQKLNKFLNVRDPRIDELLKISEVTTADKIPTPEKTRTRDMYKNAFKGQEGFINSELLKDVGRGAGKVLQYLPTPAATVGLSAGFGVDPKSSLDRAILGTELAAAPALVKQSSKIASNPLLRRFLNLGLSPKMAMRAARIASPLGIASLGGEALYQYGKFAKDEIAKVKAMGDDERRVYNESLMDEGGLFE